MKKLSILFVALVFATASFGQNYITKTGHIWFFSSAPMEDIEAHNYQVTSVISADRGEMVFKSLLKGFQFEKALMQEHFNEKYVESDKYPESTFQGKILNLNEIDLTKDGKFDVKVEGDLKIHGITNKVKAGGTLEVKGDKMIAISKFQVAVTDYKINIPGSVKDNIAEVIDIHVEMDYNKLVKK